MKAYDRFEVKQLQADYEYTDLVIDKVDSAMNRDDYDTQDEYNYDLHKAVHFIVHGMKPYMEAGYSFTDAYEIIASDYLK